MFHISFKSGFHTTTKRTIFNRTFQVKYLQQTYTFRNNFSNLLKLFVGIIEGEGGLLAWCDLVPGVEEASLVLSIVFWSDLRWSLPRSGPVVLTGASVILGLNILSSGRGEERWEEIIAFQYFGCNNWIKYWHWFNDPDCSWLIVFINYIF